MKRIAFLGISGHTQPTQRALLNKLSEAFSITIYSEVLIHPDWLNGEHLYSIRCFKGMGFSTHVRAIIFLFKFIWEHARHPFDLVHAHSTYPTGLTAVILQKFFRVPAVVSLDGGEGVYIPIALFGDGHSRKRRWLTQWIVHHARSVVTLTFFQRDLVRRNLNIKKEMKVITRGVDSDVFPFSSRERKGPVNFLSIGYLHPVKDPATMLRTFLLVNRQLDCKLIHVGKDYMNGVIQKMALELGIAEKVSFVDRADYTAIYEYYKNADILLHTPVFESQALVVAEAMACGTLVCGTNVGLLNDLSGTCCVTAPPQNAEALSVAIMNLLNNEDEMSRLRTNAHNWSKNHSLDRTVQAYSQLYTQMMGS